MLIYSDLLSLILIHVHSKAVIKLGCTNQEDLTPPSNTSIFKGKHINYGFK